MADNKIKYMGFYNMKDLCGILSDIQWILGEHEVTVKVVDDKYPVYEDPRTAIITVVVDKHEPALVDLGFEIHDN